MKVLSRDLVTIKEDLIITIILKNIITKNKNQINGVSSR